MTGGALAAAMLMISGILVLIAVNGLGSMWPKPLVRIVTEDGTAFLGSIEGREAIPEHVEESGGERFLMRIANRDLYGIDFRWFDESDVVSSDRPEEALLAERREWGPFHGFLVELHLPEGSISGDRLWERFREEIDRAGARRGRIEKIERTHVGRINKEIESARLRIRRIEIEGGVRETSREIAELESGIERWTEEYERLRERLTEMRQADGRHRVVLRSARYEVREFPISHIVRAYRPNEMGLSGKVGVYLSRIWDFVSKEPRESNTEGGIFPAIFGTVLMTLIMTVAVVPLGVLAALYLREYATQGPIVTAVRIAVNNLAGVPSIVFGLFGLGFFAYLVGGAIDSAFFPERLPAPTFGGGGLLWASLTLALLTVPVVIVATEEALAAVPTGIREGSIACGASKFQTVIRIVLPSAAPGIMTGAILAMARGAGEVAPLMITGVVKLAPELPLDGTFPYLHLERKFMHLGFHIYDVGFQSPNVEAAKPMVYATTLLLILIVVLLNLTAIIVRNKLRDKYKTGAFG